MNLSLLPLIAAQLFLIPAGAQSQLLSTSEVKEMELLRLWHTRPVVENVDLSRFNKSDSGDLEVLPEQIFGRHAHFKSRLRSQSPRAKEVACLNNGAAGSGSSGSQVSDSSGVLRMSGLTYASSAEPEFKFTGKAIQEPERYRQGTSLQIGQDFSFGGWVRFGNNSVDKELFELGTGERSKLRGVVPAYYTLLSKAPDPLDKNSKRLYLPEWQFYLTDEMLYLGTFQGNVESLYYGREAVVKPWIEYQNCISHKEAANSGEPIPLAKSSKPVPIPVIGSSSARNAGPCILPPAPLRPPPAYEMGNEKIHLYDFDIKSGFKWAETWSSTYVVGPKEKASHGNSEQYEAWHFLNVSFKLSNPVTPYLEITIISLPYFDGLKDSPRNMLSQCIYKSKRDSQLLPGKQCTEKTIRVLLKTNSPNALALSKLMNESDSPVMLGLGWLQSDVHEGLADRNRIYRSGTYIARSFLSDQQALRMAQVLYPDEAVNCLTKDLVTVKKSTLDFPNEALR